MGRIETYTLYLAAILLATVTASHAQDGFITTNRTIADGNPVNTAFTNLTVGRLTGGGARVPGVNADVITPASVGTRMFTYSDSVTNLYGGTVNELQLLDTSTVTIRGTNAVTRIIADTDSRLNITGGTVDNILLRGDLDMSGGYVRIADSNATVPGTIDATIRGGTIDRFTNASSKSRTQMTGGTINSVGVRQGIMEIIGGTVNGVYVATPDATTSPVPALKIAGGTINGGVVASTDGTAEIAGGVFDSGVDGRTFATLLRSTISFVGRDLVLSAPTPATLSYVGYTNSGTSFSNVAGSNYTLTGILADGTPINRVVFDATGAGATGGFNIVNLPPVAVPESSTRALFVLPIIALSMAVPRRYEVSNNSEMA